MTRSKSIFLAFAGSDVSKEPDAVTEIGDGYECWNLTKFTRASFVAALKEKIPPINNNVLRNYEVEDGSDRYGITEEKFKKCSWGLLIPDCLDDAVVDAHAETIFLLNLYSPSFLYPVFRAGDMGIITEQYDSLSNLNVYFPLSNQFEFFKKKEFVTFFKLLLPQSQYGTWLLPRIQTWKEEDWRLFVAALLYSGLKEYDNRKTSFGWQRESADMATILESLFTAGDSRNEEVTYRLRKRMAVLLSTKFSSIEDDIKDLYGARSDFVHGRFFQQIAKDSKQSYNNLPTPDFSVLYNQKERVRLALVAYMYLADIVKKNPDGFGGQTSLMKILEKAIIDIPLRNKISEEVGKIFALVPESDIRFG